MKESGLNESGLNESGLNESGLNDSGLSESGLSESKMNESEINELERILANDEELQPMTGFSARVMRAVREEATVTAPIAFPWARFLPGLLLNLGLLLGAAVWMILVPGSSPPAPLNPAEWFAGPQAQGLLWAALTVLGSGVLAWTATRWVTPRRSAFL